jgi:hypothetical protein
MYVRGQSNVSAATSYSFSLKSSYRVGTVHRSPQRYSKSVRILRYHIQYSLHSHVSIDEFNDINAVKPTATGVTTAKPLVLTPSRY